MCETKPRSYKSSKLSWISYHDFNVLPMTFELAVTIEKYFYIKSFGIFERSLRAESLHDIV